MRIEFFSAAAQLIPLLVVAAAVDTRAWASASRQRPSDVAFDVISLLMLTLAWMCSMLVVATGSVRAAEEVAVVMGWRLAGSRSSGRLPSTRPNALAERRSPSAFEPGFCYSSRHR